MSQLKSINSSLEMLKEIHSKLEAGNLTMEELNQFVDAAQNIHELAVILRFKAYENKVNPESPLETSAEMSEFREEPEVAFNESIAIQAEEALHAGLGSSTEHEIIESQHTSDAFSFDLFNDNTEALRVEIPEEEVVEHMNITATSHEEFGVEEEIVVMEQSKRKPVEEENKVFIEHFSLIEADLFNQIGMSRLETLNNCFGLNEKFVYINELFKGSKDEFNEAIQQIDNDLSYHDALLTASIYANKYNWDIESSTVQDFVTKLKRRHG